ncbi:MAG: DNA topoisomerase (ATP-hydrolyzing) subunit A [Eubacteriales bacterium]|nr:DNA topoisomerase (ATP-hydrolyzing) subunit A [Eubacteriales bacterium]
MAKKTKDTNETENIIITEQKITDTLELNYMPYAMSVIVSRAIPEIDGFKPSHRKLLYTMYKMGLQNGARTKSSNIVGQTMHLNPHGDAAIYETMVRLTEGNGSLLLPFIDSKGNFGKQYSRDMAYAAARYTEAKLAPICNEVFGDIDKNSVDFVDNFDATDKEPVLLPTSFPNILVNPNQGIAVGMASSFCSFNLVEICEATSAFISNPDYNIADYIKGPDFPGGGELIYNPDEMNAIYESGRGSFKVRAKYRCDKKNSCIEIYEIPYTTNVETIIDKIIQLVKSGKIRDITDVRDETDLKGLKIAIDIKRSADPEMLMAKLFSLTTLCDSFSCNFNLLINGRPKTLGIKGVMEEWVIFRMDCVKRRLKYDLDKKSAKLHLLQGLSKILLDIDKAIDIIRNTEVDAMVIPNLITGFDIDQKQAEYVAEIKLRNINKEYILNRIQEISELVDSIADLTAILSSDAKVKRIISKELKNVAKKYGTPRRTSIISDVDTEKLQAEDLIEDYGIKLFLTVHNYFKKIPLTSLRTSPEQKLKEEDSIMYECEATNRTDIVFFSDKHNVYKLKANDIADCKASSFGEYLANILNLEENEKIIYFTATTDYSGYMIFAFENGKVAKVPLESYATKTNRKKLVNAYSPKSPVIGMTYSSGDCDIVLIRDTDKALLFNTELIPLNVNKTSGGVQVFTMKKKSFITRMFNSSDFISDDIEKYRTKKLTSSGVALTQEESEKNNIPGQIRL